MEPQNLITVFTTVPPLVPILSQMHPVHTFPFYFSTEIHSNIILLFSDSLNPGQFNGAMKIASLTEVMLNPSMKTVLRQRFASKNGKCLLYSGIATEGRFLEANTYTGGRVVLVCFKFPFALYLICVVETCSCFQMETNL
jgi:hypothetical protein